MDSFDPGARNPRPIGRSARERWDRIDPNAFSGRYGDYLLRKVGAVFPELKTSSGF